MITAINSLPYSIDPAKKIAELGQRHNRYKPNQERIHHLLADSIPPTSNIDRAQSTIQWGLPQTKHESLIHML